MGSWRPPAAGLAPLSYLFVSKQIVVGGVCLECPKISPAEALCNISFLSSLFYLLLFHTWIVITLAGVAPQRVCVLVSGQTVLRILCFNAESTSSRTCRQYLV